MIRWNGVLAGLLVSLAFCAGACGKIISVAFDDSAKSLDLTAAGEQDWAVFGRGWGVSERGRLLDAADFKKGGSGIVKQLKVSGLTKAFGGDGVEGTMWTGVSWAWMDGMRRKSVVHRHGDETGTGMRLELEAGGSVVFEFDGAGKDRCRLAYLLIRRDNPIEIVAVQGKQEKAVHVNQGKAVGLAIVKYSGESGLRIELRSTERRATARGFAAALSGPVDSTGELPTVPTLQDVIARKALGLGRIDFLQAAVDFADCMIKYGRDRYGKVHSPLFAVLLTREKEPKIGPYPLFADAGRTAKNMSTPFNRFDFNKVLNYPGGLGNEGPHKVTICGCDPFEDRELYYMLFELSRITGEPKYRQEAEEALTWWFKHTQGPGGLYPCGEHLGWDFEHECPTYFAGPSKHLYAACYHEIKDDVPFLDILVRISGGRRSRLTPLEKYALGVWEAHFWDKDKAYFCRHGDYTGRDDRRGSGEGYPAHLGAYLRIWSAAYLNSQNVSFKQEIEGIFNKVLDMGISRTKKYGFFPFTFAPELKGKDAGKEVPGQSIRLAHHAVEVSQQLKKVNPGVAGKLRELAMLHLGADKVEQAVANLEAYETTGDREYLQGGKSAGKKPRAGVRDLSDSRTAGAYAVAIIENLGLYRRYADKAYLRAAETYGRIAYATFCDDVCPLPKARAGGYSKTTQGEPFGDFYFRGAKLMRAFALLGEAERKAGE